MSRLRGCCCERSNTMNKTDAAIVAAFSAGRDGTVKSAEEMIEARSAALSEPREFLEVRREAGLLCLKQYGSKVWAGCIDGSEWVKDFGTEARAKYAVSPSGLIAIFLPDWSRE